MNEKLLGSNAVEGWDDLAIERPKILEDYEEAVREINEEYLDKTDFEKRVMFELVINDKEKKRLTDEGHYDSRFFPASKERIKHELEYDFDFGMNCGGFALKIFSCLFSKSKNIEEATENILKQFPFVRVLDEEGLKDGEYEVLYRKNENGGHHFIKRLGDKFIEKDGSGPIRDFNEWPDSLKDAPEVIFAVSREHEIEPRDEEGNRIYSYFI